MRSYVPVFSVCLGIASFSLNAADTEIKLYRPFASTSSNMKVSVKEKYPGQCWQQSILLTREDAWVCIANGKTWDPCFIKPFGSDKRALCPVSPWDNAVTELELASPVDNTGHIPLDVSQAYPWAVELKSGEKCQKLKVEMVFDNSPVRYQCSNQTVLFGHLQRCKTPWTILQRSKDDKVETAVIEKAWY